MESTFPKPWGQITHSFSSAVPITFPGQQQWRPTSPFSRQFFFEHRDPDSSFPSSTPRKFWLYWSCPNFSLVLWPFTSRYLLRWTLWDRHWCYPASSPQYQTQWYYPSIYSFSPISVPSSHPIFPSFPSWILHHNTWDFLALLSFYYTSNTLLESM